MELADLRRPLKDILRCKPNSALLDISEVIGRIRILSESAPSSCKSTLRGGNFLPEKKKDDSTEGS